MPNGWFRVKLAPFESHQEREMFIRQALMPAIETLERTQDLIKYYVLHHDDVKDIMINFYGDPWKLMEEIRRNKWGHRIMPGMPERFDPTDETNRFHADYLVGICLFELGSRLALANRQARELLDWSRGKPDSILTAMRHSFYNGLLAGDTAEMNQVLRVLHEIFTRQNPMPEV